MRAGRAGERAVPALRPAENARFAGKRLFEVAQLMGKDWKEATMDLIISERGRVETVYFLMSEENVRTKMRQPWMKLDPTPAATTATPGGLTHPRSYGNYRGSWESTSAKSASSPWKTRCAR